MAWLLSVYFLLFCYAEIAIGCAPYYKSVHFKRHVETIMLEDRMATSDECKASFDELTHGVSFAGDVITNARTTYDQEPVMFEWHCARMCEASCSYYQTSTAKSVTISNVNPQAKLYEEAHVMCTCVGTSATGCQNTYSLPDMVDTYVKECLGDERLVIPANKVYEKASDEKLAMIAITTEQQLASDKLADILEKQKECCAAPPVPEGLHELCTEHANDFDEPDLLPIRTSAELTPKGSTRTELAMFYKNAVSAAYGFVDVERTDGQDNEYGTGLLTMTTGSAVQLDHSAVSDEVDPPFDVLAIQIPKHMKISSESAYVRIYQMSEGSYNVIVDFSYLLPNGYQSTEAEKQRLGDGFVRYFAQSAKMSLVPLNKRGRCDTDAYYLEELALGGGVDGATFTYTISTGELDKATYHDPPRFVIFAVLDVNDPPDGAVPYEVCGAQQTPAIDLAYVHETECRGGGGAQAPSQGSSFDWGK